MFTIDSELSHLFFCKNHLWVQESLIHLEVGIVIQEYQNYS